MALMILSGRTEVFLGFVIQADIESGEVTTLVEEAAAEILLDRTTTAFGIPDGGSI